MASEQQQQQDATGTKFESKNWLSDEEIMARGVPKSAVELYRRHVYQQAFSVSTWYPAIEEHTFRSSLVQLDFAEAQALLGANENLARQRNARFELQRLRKAGTAPPPTPGEADLPDDWKRDLPEETVRLVLGVQERLDAAIRSFDGGAFIKLNTRSPKDVVIDRTDDPENTTRVLDQLREALGVAAQRGRENPAMVEQLCGSWRDFLINEAFGEFAKISLALLRVTTGSEALDLLLKSQRIQQDLTKIVNLGPSVTPDTAVVVREWHPEVPRQADMEFRGFVYKNKLNALSQYDDITFSVRVRDNKSEIAALIQGLFESSISQKLEEHENYIIDFFVDFEHKKVFVIELNPFHIGAGPALFTWKDNRELFMNGPFEFRIVEKVRTDSLEKLPVFWERGLLELVEHILGEDKDKEDKKSGCNLS